jgi:hypothetical protein
MDNDWVTNHVPGVRCRDLVVIATVKLRPKSLLSELWIHEVITALRLTASVTSFQTQQVFSIEMRRPGRLRVCDIDHSSCRSDKT